MNYPVVWANQLGNGMTFDAKPDSTWAFSFKGPNYGEEQCLDPWPACSGCAVEGMSRFLQGAAAKSCEQVDVDS